MNEKQTLFDRPELLLESRFHVIAKNLKLKFDKKKFKFTKHTFDNYYRPNPPPVDGKGCLILDYIFVAKLLFHQNEGKGGILWI